MDRLRQQLFAGAGFTKQENRSVCAGHTFRLGKHFLERPALADDSPVVMLQRDLLTKIDVLLFELTSEPLAFSQRGPDGFLVPFVEQAHWQTSPRSFARGRQCSDPSSPRDGKTKN